MYVDVCEYVHMSGGAHGGQKRRIDPLLMKLQAFVGC